MHLLKSIIRKSQMAFDFGKHDHHVAYTRTNASGTVSHIQAKGVQPDMHAMVQTARRWKGAAMNADEDHGTDNRARLKHSRMTTKADLDNYLVRKFGVDEVTARNVSNHLTEKDIPADRTAEPSEFAGEPWADAVLAKQKAVVADIPKRADALKDMPDPTGVETLLHRQVHAKDNFDDALMTIAGITREQAQRVTQYYLDKKLAVMDSVNGTIRPKHGAYLDKEVVLNAVKETEPEEKINLPEFGKPARKPRTKPASRPAPKHRIAKVDEDGGHGLFVIYDKDMKAVEIPNEQGEIEAAWPRLVDATRALDRHTGATHTKQKVARGEYDLQRSVAHPVSLIKSRKLDGSINFQGMDISIETGRSRIRSWYNPHDGSQGMSRMTLPYGYIKGTLGTDGDHVDVFVGPDHSAGNVYVVHTMKAPDFTEYDEDKCFVGLNSPKETERAFNASYSDPRFYGGMSIWQIDAFKEAVKTCRGKKLDSSIFKDSIGTAPLAYPPPVDSANGIQTGPARLEKAGMGKFFTENEAREYALLGVLKVNPKDICMDEFRHGMKAEQEHQDITGGDRIMTAKIVLAHLKEDPRYYSKLKRAGLE